MKKAKKSEEDFDAKSAKSNAKNAKASFGGSRVSASAGEDGGNVRVERVERVERNSRVEHREHKELGEPWPRAKLGEIAEVQLGKMLDKAKNTGEPYPYLANVSVQWGRFDLTDLRTTLFTEKEVEKFSLKRGDILMCEGGVPGRCAIWREDNSPIKYQKALHRIRLYKDLPEYVALFFESIQGDVDFERLFTGATIKHLPRERLVEIELPLPPLAVQRAVVARLEGEMKAVERLEAGFREMGAAAEAAFTAELAEAFAAGAGAGEDGGNVRVERIERVEENSRVEHKEHKEPGLVGAGVPARPRGASGGSCVSASAGDPAEGGFFNAEKGERGRRGEGEPWPRAKLGEVCETGAGGTPLKQHSEYYDGGDIPWLRSGEVCQKDICKTELFITKAGMDNSSAKLFPANSVVVAMYGATAGQVGILRIEATTNQAVCAIFPNERYLPEFLYYQLCNLKSVMVEQARGGAQPNISQIKIRSLEIVLPPLAVQRSIVSRLEAAAGRRARIVALASEGAAAAADLRRAILKEAFE